MASRRRNLSLRSQKLRESEQQTETDTDAECEGDLVCIGDPNADARDTTIVLRSIRADVDTDVQIDTDRERNSNFMHV
jgi:hypothetical protein